MDTLDFMKSVHDISMRSERGGVKSATGMIPVIEKAGRKVVFGS